MSHFTRSWLSSAGKVWNPTDLLIVVSDDVLASEDHLQAMSRLENLGSRICSLDSFYERHLGRTRVRPGESILLRLPLHEDRSAYGFVKSVLEVAVAMAGLALLAVLGPFIALAIKVSSSGPVLYRQERVGLHGRRFVLLKFRSMKADAEDTGARFAADGDGRVTAVGRVLRRTRLDELPQMWNVLRREMSLVGPRPERPQFVAQLTALFPAYSKRLLVRPGITGWAQVNDAYASSAIEDHRRKLERDLYYVRHRSPTLDLQCVARTLGSVARMHGQ
jgi:lipopolysaccharide/colanic/teichoic acid biosynthesis glycosyltransferase